ncbi:TerB family tellurite resistance protein [Myxococcus sp. RHSTA-1-4]|uniref:TerB family tellurite resistance protein n=1 Tax=Myxococcus sp. RHSTA-1-4 TaxID=2874601 RepID=UPI001CC01470|nr:TerB family tellurite resistance protein [Myxococcus sp. RHSTA-1-4]MBZ4415960.1 TerB family tellurite resistance protein [Myxococcus sp. RHSTA-1-4]
MGAGKVLGAIIGLGVGLLIGHPLAIILLVVAGAFVGHHFFDEQHAAFTDPDVLADFAIPLPQPWDEDRPGVEATESSRQEEPYEELARDLCALFVEVAHADGDVRREEVREVRRYFETVLGYGPESLQLVRGHLKTFLARPPDLDAAARACAAQLPSMERRRLLDALFELALVDGPLQRSEREALRRAARGLGVSVVDEQAIAADHLGDADDHYAVLGLTPDATDAEVKKAYRQLVAEYHPDKAAHAGREAAEQAARRFQEIRDAYEEIRRLRGL